MIILSIFIPGKYLLATFLLLNINVIIDFISCSMYEYINTQSILLIDFSSISDLILIKETVPVYPIAYIRFNNISISRSESPVLEVLKGCLRARNDHTIFRLQAVVGGNSLNCGRNLLYQLSVYYCHFGRFGRDLVVGNKFEG